VSIYNVKKFSGAKPPDPRDRERRRGRKKGEGREGKGRERSGTKGRRPQFFALYRKKK
jgi:hypothetical protein